MTLLDHLCFETNTSQKDWEELDHPSSGIGIERWFKNKHTSEEYYLIDDQGFISCSKI